MYKKTKSVIGEAQNGRANGHQSGKQTSDVLLGSDLHLNCLQRLSADNTSRHSHFSLSASSTHPKITEKMLTRFNSLPHIFPHWEITRMQRVLSSRKTTATGHKFSLHNLPSLLKLRAW